MTLLLVMNLGFAWGPVSVPTPAHTFGHRSGPIEHGSAHRSGPIQHATPKRSMSVDGDDDAQVAA